MNLKFRLDEGARCPERGSKQAAGLDIHSNQSWVLEGGERKLFKTGVYLEQLPQETYIRIAPRSKLANKFGINVLAGVVDADYRGEICVVLHNTDKKSYLVRTGEAIAQLILEQIVYTTPEVVTEATDTERGEKGINCSEERR